MSTGAPPLFVRLPNWLGDLVLAWPVVEAAAREEVLFVGPAPFEPFLRARFARARYLPWDRRHRYALAGAIRRERPRAALLLTESFSSAALAALAGVPERIGYDAECRGFLLTRRVARETPARSTPRESEYRTLARAARLFVEAFPPTIAANPAELDSARDLLARLGASRSSTEGYLVVAAGAAYGPAKQWGGARFGEAASALARERGWVVVAAGTRGDREASREALETAQRHGAAVVDTTGATDLPALAGLLAGASLVLGNDSGVMHLAAALRRPTVAIFGSTSPLWTAATGPWVSNLYAGYPCSPCFRRTCAIGYGCLRAIEPREVQEAGERLLGSEAEGERAYLARRE